MEKNQFKLTYEGKAIDLDVESGKIELWRTLSQTDNDEKIGLFIEVNAKGKEIEFSDDEEDTRYIKPRIYTEWLDIPIGQIKNKDFRTLETVEINFSDSGEMDELEKMIFTEAPGALYIDSHGLFENVKITLKYVGAGMFKVDLIGLAEFDTSFEVSATIPFGVELKTYDKRATKEDIINFFEHILNKDEFESNWRYRDDDIFFKATPKETKTE